MPWGITTLLSSSLLILLCCHYFILIVLLLVSVESASESSKLAASFERSVKMQVIEKDKNKSLREFENRLL